MRKLDILLGLALATSVAVAYSLWTQLQDERALTQQLRSRVSVAEPTPERTAPSPAPVVPATPTPAAEARPDVPARSESPERAAGRKQEWQAYQRQLLKDPRYVAALREQRRLTYRLRRDNAMRLFGFSADAADAIIDLDIDQELQVMAGDDETDGGLSDRIATAQRDHDAKLLELLGRDRFDRWQTYMETRGTRMQVDRFRTQLSGADALRDDQVEPLITALAAEQQQMRDEIDAYRESLSRDGGDADASRDFRARQIEITKAAHRRMLASASSILSTSQTRRLEDMLAADLAQRAMRERMESLRRKIETSPTTDGGD